MGTTQPSWMVLSNHGMVLFHIAAHPHSTLRALSDTLGITERQVARILKDLMTGGMVQIQRRGRRNFYIVDPDAHFRHPTLAHIPLRPIYETLVPQMARDLEASP